MRTRTAQEPTEGHARQLQIVGKAGVAGGLGQTVWLRYRRADDVKRFLGACQTGTSCLASLTRRRSAASSTASKIFT